MSTPGLNTNRLTLTVSGNSVTPEVSKAVVGVGDSASDFVSFTMAATGGAKDWKLSLTFVQLAQLWDLMDTAAGTVVPVVVRPYGNAVATALQPHWHGDITVTYPDGDYLGGEADASSTARFTVDVDWMFTDKPTKVVA